MFFRYSRYIVDSNTYTNAAAGATMGFAVEAAEALGLNPESLAGWKNKSISMLIPTAEFCLTWPNASLDGETDEMSVSVN